MSSCTKLTLPLSCLPACLPVCAPHAAWNGAASGCATGLALGWKQGPLGALQVSLSCLHDARGLGCVVGRSAAQAQSRHSREHAARARWGSAGSTA